MVSLLVAAVLGMPAQDAPLGQISKEQLFQEIRALGYVVLEDKESTLLVDGKTRVHLSAGMHRADSGALFVGGATGRLEFDLPKSLPKKELQDWAKQQRIGKSVTTGSLFGGRIYVEGWLFDESTTRPELKLRTRELLDASKKVANFVEARGGKPSPSIHAIGSAPYEPDFRLDWIEAEDLDYLRETLNWGRKVLPGGSKFWSTGAEPLGIPVWFSGGPKEWRGFSLTSSTREPKPSGLERYLKNPIDPEWANLFIVRKDLVHIQKDYDFRDGVTVRELVTHILDFAQKVKALDLF